MPLFPNTKLLKIALPVTTLTAATIITATLLFSNREDFKLTSLNDEALENYDKELDPYKEETVKQAEEEQETDNQSESKDDHKGPKGEEDKPKDASTEDLKSKEKEGQENQKSLKELFEAKIEGENSRATLEKLLENPEQVVKDLLEGKGVEPPSKEQIQEITELAKEKLQEINQEEKAFSSGEPQKDPIQEEGGGQPPSQAEKDLPLEESHIPNPEEDSIPSENKIGETSSTPVEEESKILNEKEHFSAPDSAQEKIDENDGVEELGEMPLGEADEELSDKEAQTDLEGSSIMEEGREKDSSGDEDTPSPSGKESEGGQDGSEGGNSIDTQYDMETLTSLRNQLGDALVSLGIKLR